MPKKIDVAWGKEEMIAKITEMMDRVQRGEISCVALRLFKPDGTWEDIAVGGTEEEKAKALADLRAARDKAN